jgi:hypothetical protein
MSDPERDQMRARLDDLSRRIDARTREFHERGEMSDLHRSLMRRIQERQDRMQSKLASAEAGGKGWDVIRTEFDRDFGSLYDDLLQLDETLDADASRSGRK